MLEAVVLATGLPASIRVTSSLDPDLDDAAIAALHVGVSGPQMLKRQPAPVIVSVEMTFTLK